MAEVQVQKRVSFKELFGWCMFDFANSSYTTVIITVVYGIIFSELIVPKVDIPGNEFRDGNRLWALAQAISFLLVVITGPIFGAITDFSARKKQFLFYSYLLCIISTACMYFVAEPGHVFLAFILIIISNFAFASGENFTSSFLPFLGPPKDLGKISGYAWAIGYFGGLASVAIVNTLGEVKPENFQSLRMVGPYTALFFMIAGIPTFLFLKEYATPFKKPEGKSYLEIGVERVIQTFKDVRYFRDLMIYLISLFFTMAALGVVIGFAFIYGSQEIKINDFQRTIMFITLQFTAATGAFLFGFIQDRIGAKKTFNLTLVMWIVCIFAIFGVKDITEYCNNNFGTSFNIQWMFVTITCLAGMGIGSTQSSSRAIVGLFSPESKRGEFFGLWGFSGKLATASGLFTVTLLQSFFGLRDSFVVISLFFVVSLIIMKAVDEKRGIQKALDYKD